MLYKTSQAYVCQGPGAVLKTCITVTLYLRFLYETGTHFASGEKDKTKELEEEKDADK